MKLNQFFKKPENTLENIGYLMQDIVRQILIKQEMLYGFITSHTYNSEQVSNQLYLVKKLTEVITDNNAALVHMLKFKRIDQRVSKVDIVNLKNVPLEAVVQTSIKSILQLSEYFLKQIVNIRDNYGFDMEPHTIGRVNSAYELLTNRIAELKQINTRQIIKTARIRRL